MNRLLFFYGTLKRGYRNHAQLQGQKFVGVAQTAPGLTLYDLGGYPGLAAAPADQTGVRGEVWEIDPAALARLDDFEGVPQGLYRRDRIALQAPFAGIAVEAYWPALPLGDRPVVGAEWIE